MRRGLCASDGIMQPVRRRAAALALCVVALAGCGDSGEDAPPGSIEVVGEVPSGIGPELEEALDLAPREITALYFTNWAALAEDAEEIAASVGGDPGLFADLEQRGLFPVRAYPSFSYPDHEDVWGWNTDDVAWEAGLVLEGDGSAVHLLRFRDSFDTGTLLPLFEERGYSKSTAGGFDVYHREQPSSAGWYVRGRHARVPVEALGMAPVDERTLLLSERRDRLESAAAALSGGAGRGIMGAVEAVGGSPSVMAFTRDVFCSADQLVADPNEDALLSAQKLEGHAYEGLAIGFAPPDGPVGAAVALHYGDATDAEADLDLREDAARGPSLHTGEPYEEGHFTLEGGNVDGQNLVLRFSPSGDGTFGFAAAILKLDLTFAAC